LAFIAGLSYQLGAVADLIPPKYKAVLAVSSAIAAAILQSLHGGFGADANPSTPPSARKVASVVVLCAFLTFGIGFLAGCVTFRVPIGQDEKYGSVDLTAKYNPPATLPGWPLAPAAGRNGSIFAGLAK
jgi:hypothetical protein